MENLKIRVNNEAESKEAQELFFELGYPWSDGKDIFDFDMPEYIVNWNNGYITVGDDFDKNRQEITLPELRDLVVLKRNDVGDANYKTNYGTQCYITGEDVYAFQNNKWVLSEMQHKDILDMIKPIEKPMKEYLDPENGYKLNLTDRPFFDWIEIPEGATYYAKDASLGKSGNFFFRLRSDDFDFEAVWLESNWIQAIFNVENQDVLWQRNNNQTIASAVESSHPEELPFIDDEPPLNDQYAEIEKVRHNHYFKDVSDVNRIDVYEVLKRFNVTDPCLQHIIKKALCAGQRGHKDFKNDLQDILDTAKRAVEINK